MSRLFSTAQRRHGNHNYKKNTHSAFNNPVLAIARAEAING